MKKIFWGLFFILSALLILLNQLDIIIGINTLDLFLTLILGAIFIKSLRRMSFFGILMPLALIGVIYSEQLGIESITPWTLIIVSFLISIGLELIFGHHHKEERKFIEEEIDSLSEIININTAFTAETKYIKSKNISRINLDCKFSGLKLYLDNATLKDNKAVINLDGSFCGIEMYIPKNWKVVDKTNHSFSGIEEKNKPSDITETELIIIGKYSFSGVDIYYV